jgi:hypothetical protein
LGHQLQTLPAQKLLQQPRPSVHRAPFGAQTQAWFSQPPLQQSALVPHALFVPRQAQTPLTEPHAPVQQLAGIDQSHG